MLSPPTKDEGITCTSYREQTMAHYITLPVCHGKAKKMTSMQRIAQTNFELWPWAASLAGYCSWQSEQPLCMISIPINMTFQFTKQDTVFLTAVRFLIKLELFYFPALALSPLPTANWISVLVLAFYHLNSLVMWFLLLLFNWFLHFASWPWLTDGLNILLLNVLVLFLWCLDWWEKKKTKTP